MKKKVTYRNAAKKKRKTVLESEEYQVNLTLSRMFVEYIAFAKATGDTFGEKMAVQRSKEHFEKAVGILNYRLATLEKKRHEEETNTDNTES